MAQADGKRGEGGMPTKAELKKKLQELEEQKKYYDREKWLALLGDQKQRHIFVTSRWFIVGWVLLMALAIIFNRGVDAVSAVMVPAAIVLGFVVVFVQVILRGNPFRMRAYYSEKSVKLEAEINNLKRQSKETN